MASIRAGRGEAGVSTVEYLAVLAGLITAWIGTDALLGLLQHHHREFSWAVGLPF